MEVLEIKELHAGNGGDTLVLLLLRNPVELEHQGPDQRPLSSSRLSLLALG